jgi:hypothetical protein
MKKFLIILSCFTGSVIFLHAASSGWTKLETRDGITVYEKDAGDFLAFRGEGYITTPIGKLLYVIEDPAHWKDWIENFDHGRILERKSPFHKVFYQAFDSPFPASDRDIVYEAKIRREAKTGKVIVDMRSVDHPKAPKTVGVRVKLKYTRYEITPMAGGRLHVTLETLSDPGGSLPGFLVNWAQRDYPIKLFQELRKQVRKPHVKSAPLPSAQ